MSDPIFGLILKNEERIYHVFTSSDKLSRHGKPLYGITFINIREPDCATYIPLEKRITKIGIKRKINSNYYSILSEDEFETVNKVLEAYAKWRHKSLEIELKRTFEE